jgi:hypothetical protein
MFSDDAQLFSAPSPPRDKTTLRAEKPFFYMNYKSTLHFQIRYKCTDAKGNVKYSVRAVYVCVCACDSI